MERRPLRRSPPCVGDWRLPRSRRAPWQRMRGVEYCSSRAASIAPTHLPVARPYAGAEGLCGGGRLRSAGMPAAVGVAARGTIALGACRFQTDIVITPRGVEREVEKPLMLRIGARRIRARSGGDGPRAGSTSR